jgi:hypothetical protein
MDFHCDKLKNLHYTACHCFPSFIM